MAVTKSPPCSASRLRDRLRVVAPQRLAGEDHHAGVDVLGVERGLLVGVVDDGAELDVVDPLLALIGRERDRRAEQRLAPDHVVAAGQLLAQPPQMHLGEDHLRAGRADVDADAGQRDVVGDPERIVLDRPVDEIVVVVVGVAVVDMRQIGAELVVGDGVAVAGGRRRSAMGQAPYSKTGSRGSPFRRSFQSKERLPLLRAVPVVDVLADLVLGDAVALLDLAFELVALAGDDVEVVVGQLAPLLLDLALDLLPVSFNAIPIHSLNPPFCWVVHDQRLCAGDGSATHQWREWAMVWVPAMELFPAQTVVYRSLRGSLSEWIRRMTTAACLRQLVSASVVGRLCHDGEPQQHDRASPQPQPSGASSWSRTRC